MASTMCQPHAETSARTKHVALSLAALCFTVWWHFRYLHILMSTRWILSFISSLTCVLLWRWAHSGWSSVQAELQAIGGDALEPFRICTSAPFSQEVMRCACLDDVRLTSAMHTFEPAKTTDRNSRRVGPGSGSTASGSSSPSAAP